jgi:hypothetical protein
MPLWMTRHWSEARRKEMAGAKAEKIVTPRLFVRAAPAGEIKLVEANMANTAAGLFENPASTDELVRDLEDSGYPVDGSREQFIRQSDGLSAATGGLAAAPVELDKRSAQRTCATPSDDRGMTGGDVSKQGNAAEVDRAS